MISAKVTRTGGRKIKRLFDTALKGGVREVDVGFFSTATYPDGTPVAAVAAWNEFGTQRGGRPHIPERPFFRRAIKSMRPGVVRLQRVPPYARG